MLDYGMKVSEELTIDDMMTSLYNLMNDGSKFLGDLLDRLDTINETADQLQDAVNNVATALRWISESIDVQNCSNAVLQKKEAVPSSPLSSPLKDEERTKEEEIISPIIPSSSSEENLCVHNAREELQNEEEMQKRSKKELQETEDSFDVFWNAYGYKRNRKEAWEAWKKLSKRDRKAAMNGIEAYKADCNKFQRPMCHASTYIHQRRWEDDFSSGLQNAEIKNGRNRIVTREDVRKLEQQQRMEAAANVAAKFRAGID